MIRHFVKWSSHALWFYLSRLRTKFYIFVQKLVDKLKSPLHPCVVHLLWRKDTRNMVHYYVLSKIWTWPIKYTWYVIPKVGTRKLVPTVAILKNPKYDEIANVRPPILNFWCKITCYSHVKTPQDKLVEFWQFLKGFIVLYAGHIHCGYALWSLWWV